MGIRDGRSDHFSPAIGSDGTVYFTAVDGYCHALISDGTLRWRMRTGGITESSPVIGPEGTIYVASTRQKLWAITPAVIKVGSKC